MQLLILLAPFAALALAAPQGSDANAASGASSVEAGLKSLTAAVSDGLKFTALLKADKEADSQATAFLGEVENLLWKLIEGVTQAANDPKIVAGQASGDDKSVAALVEDGPTLLLDRALDAAGVDADKVSGTILPPAELTQLKEKLKAIFQQVQCNFVPVVRALLKKDENDGNGKDKDAAQVTGTSGGNDSKEAGVPEGSVPMTNKQGGNQAPAPGEQEGRNSLLGGDPDQTIAKKKPTNRKRVCRARPRKA